MFLIAMVLSVCLYYVCCCLCELYLNSSSPFLPPLPPICLPFPPLPISPPSPPLPLPFSSSCIYTLVPACDGKGSYDSLNGIKASEYLIQAEALCSQVSPFSWVLFRPPWSPEVISSKMCVFHHMRLACQNAESEQQVHTSTAYVTNINFALTCTVTLHCTITEFSATFKPT